MLKYIGRGEYLFGVPARDLTDEEVDKIGKDWLLHTGLYIEPPKQSTDKIKEKTEKEN